jgi:hypothetical protein
MEKLLAWADDAPSRHFLVRKCGSCIETRWRVCVWVKPEGSFLIGAPGEGFDVSLPVAIDMALLNWEAQKRLVPSRNDQFYAPTKLTGWLAPPEKPEWLREP